MPKFGLSVIFVCTASVAAFATVPNPPALRLDPAVTPKLYKASLNITPGKSAFSATLTIRLDITKATDQIWVNAEDLTIDSAALLAGTKKSKLQIVTNVKGLAGFLFDRPIEPGPATLALRYRGTVTDKPGPGLSHSSRDGSDYVVTHFEPIAARRVFPCFDEPNFKAPWQLTVDAPASDMVVSNTSMESDTPHGARHHVVFHETKPLPSYLVAFTIGAYETVEVGRIGRNRVPARIVVPKGDQAKAGFVARILPRIVEQLENYFDIAYPYDKLDQVAVPNYPENSAMEDAGSILYDDSLILCPPERLTHETEERILWLIIHETTHQWFGDLVTLAWWDDAWLNEGFTEWLQWKMQGEWGSEWRDDLSAIDDLERVVHQDVRSVAHPVRQQITSPGEIETEFDDITYFKTAEVLGMIEHYIGPDTLRSCIRRYMQAHLFANATSQDFSNELAKANPDAVVSFEQYLNRKGLPQLTAALDCSKNDPVVHLHQETFHPLGVQKTGAEDLWTFPVCMRYSNGQSTMDTCTIVKDQDVDVRLSAARSGCPAWLVGNEDASGYYITRYDPASFEKLSNSLHSMSRLDQLHTLWEISFLVNSGREKPSRLLETIRAYGPYSTVPDLLAALRFSSPLLRYETSPEDIRSLTAYFENTFGETGRKLGWLPPSGAAAKDREDHLDAVSAIAVLGQDRELIQSATRLSGEWLRNRNAIPADVVGPVLAVAGRFAAEDFYNRLLNAAKAETDHEKKLRMLIGLGCVHEPALIKKNFALFTSGAFPLNESPVLLLGLTRSRAHTLREMQRMPLEFIQQHTAEVRSRFPTPLGRDYSMYFAGAAAGLCSESDSELADAALSPILRPAEGGNQRLAEALEAIKLCTVAREATQADFETALASSGGGSGATTANH